MFPHILSTFLFIAYGATICVAHPIRSLQPVNSTSFRGAARDIQELLQGNARFRNEVEGEHPGYLEESGTTAQHPPFLFLGCSDSRVSEGTLFHALPGKLFSERNIANQFQSWDTNANAVLTYGVEHLGIHNIIVMGHYGCGGVSAAITSAFSTPDLGDPVQRWIEPIRKLFLSSTRKEIAELRERSRHANPVPEPALHDPGYRALVEENIKANVRRVSQARITKGTETEESEQETFVHGWIYDMESGDVSDLGVSTKLEG